MTFVRDEAVKSSSDEAEAPMGKIDAGKVVELSAFAFLLVVSVAATSQLGGLSAIVVVAMASLVFPVAWMAAIGRFPTYAREFRGDYFNNKLPQSKNQIVLFAGAGFFAQSIGYSHLGDALVGSLLHMTGQSVLLLTVAIIGITLATSAVGIHPIAVVAVVGGAMGASQWGVSPPTSLLFCRSAGRWGMRFALRLRMSWPFPTWSGNRRSRSAYGGTVRTRWLRPRCSCSCSPWRGWVDCCSGDCDRLFMEMYRNR